MLSVPPNSSTTLAAANHFSFSSSSNPDFFLKDGRKIFVGDCALFKPPQDSPPFIGIIRKLIAGKESGLSLLVDWLYRPSEIRLGKGVLLDAAPNEVFYSFHKDEIPAASLLHPCKVAFLHKGVELPSRISSFVCRRVYDIENKWLWWLIDKDYVNERQEEVDRLLDKTRLEMHGVMQSGGQSPKPLNGPTSATQSKPNSDSAQNSSSFSSHSKGKKRERGDQVADLSKRERLSKSEDGDLGQSKGGEHMLESEIAKITDKGGLFDFEGVEKLVQLMQLDSADKRLDLASRMMLVDVVAATDSLDWLGQFVQLKGLPVLDEWLQEVHKGKFGDGSSPKESEKGVEEFLLALLRALDKLPVNLHALQTCNVGKSVNHLRTHKNSEIQKKARSLVDTWKKRVEAEMTMNDTKSGLARAVSWPAKPAPSEVSHVGNRKSGGPAEAGLRSSVVQSSTPKSSQVKLAAGEGAAKSSLLPGTMKSVTVSVGGNSKDANSKMLTGAGTSDPPLTPFKEERSSSSSQSQNNSQSCSSDHAKPVGSSCREDARSSTAGSANVSKGSSGVFRHRKSSNGVPASAAAGFQKEPGSGKVNSGNKNSTVQRASSTGVSHDKTHDVSRVDHGNNQRLIVRFPNTSCSPTRGSNGGSFEDIAATSRASPPGEKPDNYDRGMRGRSEVSQPDTGLNVNSDLCQEKDGLCGADKAKVITACDEQLKIGEDGVKVVEESKAASSLLGVLPRTGALCHASLSSINALVESCAKSSVASAPASAEDDVGMNLLASVAAGEVLKADVLPFASPLKGLPVEEGSSAGEDGKSTRMGNEDTQIQNKLGNVGCADSIADKHASVNLLRGKNEGTDLPLSMLANTSVDRKISLVANADKKVENSVALNSLEQTAEIPYMGSDVKPADVTCGTSVLALSDHPKTVSHTEVERINQSHEHRKSGIQRGRSCNNSESKIRVKVPACTDDTNVDFTDEGTGESNVAVISELAAVNAKVDKELDEKVAYSSLETVYPEKNLVGRESHGNVLTEHRFSHNAEVEQDSSDRKNEDASPPSASENILPIEPKAEIPCDAKEGGHTEQNERTTCLVSSVPERHSISTREILQRKEAPGVYVSCMESPPMAGHVNEPLDNSCLSKLDRVESEWMEERRASSANASISAAGSGMAVKLDFDLNEGFSADNGNPAEPAKSIFSGASVHLPCPLPIPLSSMSGSFSNSITVATAAKGSFVLPENPLRSKGELGWKGSAATSAFRPAEPRKNFEILNTGEVSMVGHGVKHGHPPLDFDLNVPDERVLEDVTSQNSSQLNCSDLRPHDCPAGGLDLDLNRVDESPDTGLLSSNTCKLEVPAVPNRLSLPVGLSNSALNASRDFDLNNGPSNDEGIIERLACSQSMKSSLPSQSTVPAVRMTCAEFGNFSSWFPPGNTYSAITVPSMPPGSGEQSYVAAAGPQRILPPSSSSTSFGLEMYRPLLSSTPAVPFPTATPFQYPGFPFETSFPLSSNTFSGASTSYMDSSSGGQLCFPAVPSHIAGTAGVVPSPYPQPYLMSLPGGSSSSIISDSRKWRGQLDLNAGPGGSDSEPKDERMPSTTRSHSIPSPQILVEQMRLCQMAGGTASSVFKRKEPDGGWDPADRFSSYKQSSWQ